MSQPGFFDVDERLKRLSNIGDQLETYARLVDFEIFGSVGIKERLVPQGFV